MDDTTAVELTPYQKLKARDKARHLKHLTEIMTLSAQKGRLGSVIELVSSRIRDKDKDELYEHLRNIGNGFVVDKIEEAVEKTTEKFTALLKLLDEDQYFKFLTEYSILPYNAKWVFERYIHRGETFFGEHHRKAGEFAKIRLNKIEMITNALIMDTKSVLTLAFDKEPLCYYYIDSNVQVIRKVAKRKRPLTSTTKVLKGGEFVFFADGLYKLVIINKSTPAQPNNVRMLKI